VVYIGSLFVIEAANRVWVSVIGIALIAIAFATSVWLALSERPGDPRPRFVAGALAAGGRQRHGAA
jgi:hypothetical protein